MEGQQVIKCKLCGGNKIERAFSRGILPVISFFGMGICIWIPIIGWILIPFFAILFIAGIIGLFVRTKNVMMKCVECKHPFKVTRDTWKEYEKEIA